jgi:hypothetical protein
MKIKHDENTTSTFHEPGVSNALVVPGANYEWTVKYRYRWETHNRHLMKCCIFNELKVSKFSKNSQEPMEILIVCRVEFCNRRALDWVDLSISIRKNLTRALHIKI